MFRKLIWAGSQELHSAHSRSYGSDKMFWIFYEMTKIPDLSLAKYQSLEEMGVEGVLDKQGAFLRQWQRLSVLLNIELHLYIGYYPEKQQGNRLKINLGFSFEDEKLKLKIDQLMKKSPLSDFFDLQKIDGTIYENQSFTYMAVAKKTERKKLSEDDSKMALYTVESWESKENARLYDMIRTMESMNEAVVYCVSLYGTDAYENVEKALGKAIGFLRKKLFGDSDAIRLNDKYNSRIKDSAAESTLKCYEQLLDVVSVSPCFQGNIKVLSNDKTTAHILLNAACAESIEKGQCKINSFEKGQYPVLASKEDFIFYHEQIPASLEFWPTLFSLEEIRPFFCLPVLYDGEYIEMPKETEPLAQYKGIYLGKRIHGNDVYIPLNTITKHAFVCGVPGAGKTNTMLHIANSLWHNRETKFGEIINRPIPFLVLEPAKREYRELSYFDIPELIIFSPNANTKFPFCINPFEFPKGLTLSEHITRLCQVFEGSFPMQPPAPFILDRSIEAIYKMHGWENNDINTGEKQYPTLTELYKEFEQQLLTTSYDSEIQGNIRSVLEMRIGSLLRREKKDIFDVERSIIEPEEWLKRPIIIELEALGKETSNFVTLLICSLIRETLKVNPMELTETKISAEGKKESWKPLRHMIFIEEAHNLIAPQSQMENIQESNPKISATECIVDMLKEVRALREGMIIADQLPTAMAMDVIKNTNLKIMHRLTSADDRGMMGSTMSASELQTEQVSTYLPGQTLISYEGLLRPFELQIRNVEQHGETPDDMTLLEIMKNKPGQKEIFKRFEGRKWYMLQKKILTIVELEISYQKALKNYSIQGKDPQQVENFFKQCYMQYQGLLLVRQTYQNEFEQLSREYIDEETVKKTKRILNALGENYYGIIQLYMKKYIGRV